METAAMLEAGIGRFQGPNLAGRLADMWAPLAVVLAALATLPSLLRRLQVLLLRLRSRGKSAISSHISTYYSSDSDGGSDGEESSDDEADAASSSDEEEDEVVGRRVGYFQSGQGEGQDGGFAWGGAVVRTWQGRGLGLRTSTGGGGSSSSGESPAVILWGARTASGAAGWRRWKADNGGRGSAAEAAAPVVVGWRHDAVRRRRWVPVLP